jgi:DNA-binding Xre family transcriptional regulator
MSELQKNIIDRLLKEKKKSKRELANFLDIKENSISRTLRNPNISISKLEKIAEFLEIDVSDLLQMKNSVLLQENQTNYIPQTKEEDGQATFKGLSEIIKIQSRTIEMMAETEKANSKNIENLVKLITDNCPGFDNKIP